MREICDGRTAGSADELFRIEVGESLNSRLHSALGRDVLCGLQIGVDQVVKGVQLVDRLRGTAGRGGGSDIGID